MVNEYKVLGEVNGSRITLQKKKNGAKVLRKKLPNGNWITIKGNTYG